MGAARERLEVGVGEGGAGRLVWAAGLAAGNGPSGRRDPSLDDLARAHPAGGVVVFGQPEASQCADLLAAGGALSWIHLSSAGYTSFDTPALRAALRDGAAPLTTSSSVFAEPCAQHALAFMLAQARALPGALDNQRGGRGWPKAELRQASLLLRRQRVLLVGFGAIARRLVELLAPFDLEVAAVRRDPRGDETVPVFPHAELDRLLGEADHVLDLLPGSASTTRLFDGRRFAACKRGAIFYNIGRGTTVDQEALCAALLEGRLGAAYLDVTDPEPLPADHPLWSTPRCWITPHTAGGHADESERLVEHFLLNLQRHRAGQDLLDRVV